MDPEPFKAEFLRAYDAYNDAIFRFCAVRVSNREVALDITQDTFMRYWQSLRKGDVVTSERAYLYTVARNLVIDWYRKKKESSLDVLTDAGIEFPAAGLTAITDNAEAREVLEVIQEMDEDDRDVLLLRFVEGYSPKEIGELLGESANTVSVRIHRALKKVQESMHTHEGL